MAVRNSRIILGICGGIAAYKTPELVRRLRKKGARVECILTENGARFVTPLTLQTLSAAPVHQGMFDPFEWDVEHVSLAKKADAVVVVPATADAIARFAGGRASDLLSGVVLATRAPVVLCPAMNEGMWEHPAMQENMRRVRSYGYHVVSPEKGELACGDTGTGRLASLEAVMAKIEQVLRK